MVDADNPQLQLHAQQSNFASSHLGLEQIRPQLDSEDFHSPQDSQAAVEMQFSDERVGAEELKHQSPSIVSLKAATVGPKADLLGSGIGTMQARKMNSPSIVDSQDSRNILSDFKYYDRNNNSSSLVKELQQNKQNIVDKNQILIDDGNHQIQEEVADESAMLKNGKRFHKSFLGIAMFNIRQATIPEGITPSKVIYALSASQKSHATFSRSHEQHQRSINCFDKILYFAMLQRRNQDNHKMPVNADDPLDSRMYHLNAIAIDQQEHHYSRERRSPENFHPPRRITAMEQQQSQHNQDAFINLSSQHNQDALQNNDKAIKAASEHVVEDSRGGGQFNNSQMQQFGQNNRRVNKSKLNESIATLLLYCNKSKLIIEQIEQQNRERQNQFPAAHTNQINQQQKKFPAHTNQIQHTLKAGKTMNRQTSLQDKKELELCVKEFKRHGKLDQNVLSESSQKTVYTFNL